MARRTKETKTLAIRSLAEAEETLCRAIENLLAEINLFRIEAETVRRRLRVDIDASQKFAGLSIIRCAGKDKSK